MVKQEDENSNSSSDASSSSSFSSTSKSRKQTSYKNQNKSTNNKNTLNHDTNLNKQSTNVSLNSNLNPATSNSIANSSQQLLYSNFSTQAFQIQTNLATMKSVANHIATANLDNPTSLVSTAPSGHSAINEQSYFQSSSSGNDGYKIPMRGALNILSTVNSSNSNSKSLISRTDNSNCSNSSNSSISSINNGNGNHISDVIAGEETVRKREMRLLKNRQAARECRRKKKEYIKCLENRVAVLENQNKTLIDELKSLKELYQNGDSSH